MLRYVHHALESVAVNYENAKKPELPIHGKSSVMSFNVRTWSIGVTYILLMAKCL